MTTLQRTFELLEMCSDAYWYMVFKKDYIPGLTKKDRDRIEISILKFESKINILFEVLNKHTQKRNETENNGRWLAQKRFYKEYPQFTPEWWKMETLLKWKNETL